MPAGSSAKRFGAQGQAYNPELEGTNPTVIRHHNRHSTADSPSKSVELNVKNENNNSLQPFA